MNSDVGIATPAAAVKRAETNDEGVDALIALEAHGLSGSSDWDELTDLCDRSR